MLNAVLFDLDGTLLDRDKSLKMFLEDQYERYHEYMVNVQRADFINYFIDFDDHGYVPKTAVYEQLFAALDISYIKPSDLLRDFDDKYPHFAYSYDDTLETLRRLQARGYKLGIITNGSTKHQTMIIDVLGLETLVTGFVISEEVGYRKPSPRIFEVMLDQLGERAEDCMFVGDHPDNDVRASRELGMIPVFKDNGYFERPSGYCITRLMELLDIVEELHANS
ncbi:HAD family hydrolase [Macrococcus equipercicus]|uniref:HAD family hydrolase n=1 Tax=Macrococcus equipercicus TaxID=69967 RepID=A0A9Q9F144_9STAP|nr:HAD family hydrolase [Macrococcus equipercicus]UTH13633.1 HAD family hydrolase [Macrococcus equipercicus]